MTILDFYRYAQLATAAYVRAGNLISGSVTYGRDFASLALTQSDGRLTLSTGQYLFAPTLEFPNANAWTIAYYHADDNPGVDENSGFGATLFQNSEENVLAIRGAEAGLTSGDIYRDLIGASIAGEQVNQINAGISTTRPPDCTVVEPGNLPIRLAPRRRP